MCCGKAATLKTTEPGLHQPPSQLRFAVCPLLTDNALNVFTNNSGGKKWQTYQFVRNQMDHI